MGRIRLEAEAKGELGWFFCCYSTLTLRCVEACGKRYCMPAVDDGKRGSTPANWRFCRDVGMFGGFPDQGEGLIDLDLKEEATLDLGAGSCSSQVRW